MKSLLILSPLIVACGETVKDGDGVVPTPTETHVNESSLTNTDCQEINGTSVPGAAVYFSGTMVKNGGTISGLEHAFFIANQAWNDTGNDNCTIAISVSGSTGEPLGCPICDISLELSATMIDSASDCPEGLQVDYESYFVTYDVQQLEDGTANWFFHESGNQFASGTHSETELQYLSDPQCQWY